MPDAKITITADDLASPVLGQVVTAAAETTSAIEALGTAGASSMDAFVEGVAGTAGSIETFNTGVGSMASASEESAQQSGSSWSSFWSDLEAKGTAAAAGVGDDIGALGETIKGALEDPLAAGKSALEGLAVAAGPVGEAFAAVGVVAAAAGVAMFELGENAAQTGEQVLNFTRITGTSVDDTNALKYGVDVLGGSLDGLQSMLVQMQRRLDATGPSADKLNTSLERMGLDAEAFRAMAPEQRILALSDALRSGADSANVMSDGLAVMGRGFMTNMPVLMKDLSGAVDAGHELGEVWTGEDLKAAEDFGVGVNTLKEHFSDLTTELGIGVLPALNSTLSGLTSVSNHIEVTDLPFVGQLVEAWKMYALLRQGDALAAAGGAAASFANANPFDGVADASLQVGGAFHTVTLSAAELKEALKTLDVQHQLLVADQKVAAEASKALAAADAVRLTSTISDINASEKLGFETQNAIGLSLQHQGVLRDMAVQTDTVTIASKDLTSATAQTGADLINTNVAVIEASERAEDLHDAWYEVAAGLGNVGPTINQMGPAVRGLGVSCQQLTTDLGEASQGFTEIGAVAHGEIGNIANDLSSLSKDAQTFTKDLSSGLKSLASGDVVGAVASGIGMIGSVVSGLATIFGGVSDAEKAARKDLSDFFSTYETQAGNQATAIQPIEDKLTSIGFTSQQAQAAVAQLLNAKTPQAYAAALAAIKPAMDAATNTSTAVTSVTSLVSAYTSAGHVIPQSMIATITSMEKLPGLTEAEKASLQGLVDSATPNFSNLASMASGLGIDLGALGPKFAQGNLTQQATTLVQNFSDLTAAGGDMGGMLQAAAGKFGDLADQAIAAGATLPASIKPMMQNLFDTGQLTDSAGVKITDFSKISFDDTPTKTGLDGIGDSMTNLQDDLTTGVPNAMAAFLKSVPVNPYAGWVPPGFPAPPSTATGDGTTSMANESFDLSRPTRAVVGDNPFQSESVLHASTVKDIVRAARAGGGSGGGDIGALHETMKAVHAGILSLGGKIEQMMALQPIMLRSALRGTR